MEVFITPKRKKIILVVVFALAIFLIIFHFTDTPRVWVDEGVFTGVARDLAFHKTIGLQIEPGSHFSMRNLLLTTGYPVIFPVATSFYLFGTGIVEARLPMIIYMFLLVLVFYLFTEKKYGFKVALLSVLMLISFSPFYGNGRPVQGEVAGLVFLVLGAWLLLFVEESKWTRKNFAIFSGIAFGLSASVKPLYLVFIPVSLLFIFLFKRKTIENKKILWFFGLGYLLPLLVWGFVHFPTLDSFKSVFKTLLYFSGNHSTSESVSSVVLHNFLRFFTESTPILFTFLLLVVLVSFCLRFFKKEGSSFSTAEFVILIFAVLNVVGYLKGTGWYRYFFPAHTLMYLLFPASIIYLATQAKGIYKKLIWFVPAGLILFQFYHLVFLSDTSFTVSRTRNIELKAELSKIDPSKKVLFYNAPEAVVFLNGENYWQYLKMDDFLEVGDINSLTNRSFDFILTDTEENASVVLSCYDKKSFSKYDLFSKKPTCE